MGEVIQLQGDQRLKIKEFLTNKDEGLGLDEKTIKVRTTSLQCTDMCTNLRIGPRLLSPTCLACRRLARESKSSFWGENTSRSGYSLILER